MDFQFSVVFDETQFAEFVHEKAHARSGRADHLRQRFLTELSHDRLWPAFLAEICQQKEKSGEALSRSEHIDGVIRQELASTEFAQRPEQLVVPGHPCSAPDVSERRCNTASHRDPSAGCPPSYGAFESSTVIGWAEDCGRVPAAARG